VVSAPSEAVIFGQHLLALRLARNLTQKQVAERARSNEPFISNLERGVKVPSLGMLIRLAQALDCNVSELVQPFDRGKR
jgi:transcriptional regulator with XRE-family HTH domain